LFGAIATRRRGKSVRDAVSGRSWVRDIQGAPTARVLCDYVLVWAKVQDVVFDDTVVDRFVWRWTADGSYSVSSVYRAFFNGMSSLRGATELWKTRAPAKCKFFFWLLLHERLWTAARRKRHGLQDEDACNLCDQEPETAMHLAGECVYAREVWYRTLHPIGLHQLAPQPGIGYLDWWLHSRLLLPSIQRRGFHSLVILVAWCIWKERNNIVFQGRSRAAAVLVVDIGEEAERWSLAGFSHLAALWAGPSA
jgi:hypothetical protein